MRTAIALVVVLGMIGGGIALSKPAGEQPRTAALQPVGLADVSAASSAVQGIPAGPPVSPRGWLIQGPNGGAFVSRIVTLTPGGYQDLEPGVMHGSAAIDNMFSSPSMNEGNTSIRVVVNGRSTVKGPGYWAHGMGPSSPGGNFSLSGGVTVTAVP